MHTIRYTVYKYRCQIKPFRCPIPHLVQRRRVVDARFRELKPQHEEFLFLTHGLHFYFYLLSNDLQMFLRKIIRYGTWLLFRMRDILRQIRILRFIH
jgi:hypothetical protein